MTQQSWEAGCRISSMQAILNAQLIHSCAEMSTIAAENIQLHANHTIQECKDNRKARSLRLKYGLKAGGQGTLKYNDCIYSTLRECARVGAHL